MDAQSRLLQQVVNLERVVQELNADKRSLDNDKNQLHAESEKWSMLAMEGEEAKQKVWAFALQRETEIFNAINAGTRLRDAAGSGACNKRQDRWDAGSEEVAIMIIIPYHAA